jgi:hypothetical protein
MAPRGVPHKTGIEKSGSSDDPGGRHGACAPTSRRRASLSRMRRTLSASEPSMCVVT